MKKAADILLRFILVVSILGAIFFYYFGRFVTNKKVVIISEKVILPPYPEIKIKKPKKIIQKNKPKFKLFYKIKIIDFPVKSEIDKIISFAKSLDNVTVKQSSAEKIVYFKRVFVGPYKSKVSLIKVENKLKSINIEPLRIKLRGYYFLHCGSFYFDKTVNEIKNKLYSIGIKNITIFKTKKRLTVYSVEILNLNEKNFEKLKKFLEKEKVEFNYENYSKSQQTEDNSSKSKK